MLRISKRKAGLAMGSKMSSSPASQGAGDLSSELARIRGLNTDQLRSLWFKLTGARPTRQLSGDLLRRMVMHSVQEQGLGGLDRQTAKILDRLADGSGVTPNRLKKGTVLVREHEGVMHQVMVVEGGFAWNDQVLPSLSAAAKAITGTTWNGNRFFGLRKAALDRATVRRKPFPSAEEGARPLAPVDGASS